jgi:hypothetical protein
VGRREARSEREAVHRPGLRARGVRPQDIDLADRPRSIRVRHGAGLTLPSAPRPTRPS